MLNDKEVKALVDEKTHDDLLVAGRAHGFDNKSEYLRWIIRTHLYGAMDLIKISRIPGRNDG
jgi:hypothetical protein